MQEETHVSSGDSYTSYLQTHSYADWVHLVEESIALRKAEDKLGSESRGSNANGGNADGRTGGNRQNAHPRGILRPVPGRELIVRSLR